MTAYLKRGDVIHLAMPGRHSEATTIAEQRQITIAYAEEGVTIATFTTIGALTHPVVVAVFRDEPEPTPTT